MFVGSWVVADQWESTDVRVFTPGSLKTYIRQQQPVLLRAEIELIASHLERSAKADQATRKCRHPGSPGGEARFAVTYCDLHRVTHEQRGVAPRLSRGLLALISFACTTAPAHARASRARYNVSARTIAPTASAA